MLRLVLDRRISWSFSHNFLKRWTGPKIFKKYMCEFFTLGFCLQSPVRDVYVNYSLGLSLVTRRISNLFLFYLHFSPNCFAFSAWRDSTEHLFPKCNQKMRFTGNDDQPRSQGLALPTPSLLSLWGREDRDPGYEVEWRLGKTVTLRMAWPDRSRFDCVTSESRHESSQVALEKNVFGLNSLFIIKMSANVPYHWLLI